MKKKIENFKSFFYRLFSKWTSIMTIYLFFSMAIVYLLTNKIFFKRYQNAKDFYAESLAKEEVLKKIVLLQKKINNNEIYHKKKNDNEFIIFLNDLLKKEGAREIKIVILSEKKKKNFQVKIKTFKIRAKIKFLALLKVIRFFDESKALSCLSKLSMHLPKLSKNKVTSLEEAVRPFLHVEMNLLFFVQ